MIEFLRQPWPWYIGGPLIGLAVPALLILTNRKFGISSSFRHVCAATYPARLPYFSYNWRSESWNLVFVTGIIAGGFAVYLLTDNSAPVIIHPDLAAELRRYGVTDHRAMVPIELFSWDALKDTRSIVLLVLGGFLVGFGTRYAGGCTSGHSIMGLSNLQSGSLIATICFMAGGFIAANILVPAILNI